MYRSVILFTSLPRPISTNSLVPLIYLSEYMSALNWDLQQNCHSFPSKHFFPVWTFILKLFSTSTLASPTKLIWRGRMAENRKKTRRKKKKKEEKGKQSGRVRRQSALLQRPCLQPSVHSCWMLALINRLASNVCCPALWRASLSPLFSVLLHGCCPGLGAFKFWLDQSAQSNSLVHLTSRFDGLQQHSARWQHRPTWHNFVLDLDITLLFLNGPYVCVCMCVSVSK